MDIEKTRNKLIDKITDEITKVLSEGANKKVPRDAMVAVVTALSGSIAYIMAYAKQSCKTRKDVDIEMLAKAILDDAIRQYNKVQKNLNETDDTVLGV